MTSDHSQSYRTLGVKPGCTWQELRSAYRRLVQTTHPDRFLTESHDKNLAEERLKTINRAFHNLASYRQRHGVLPNPAATLTDVHAAATHFTDSPTSTDSAYQKSPSPREPRTEAGESPLTPDGSPYYNARLRSMLRWGGGIAVTLLIFEAIWTTSPQNPAEREVAQSPVRLAETPKTPNTSQSGEITAPVTGEYFTIGSSMGEVYEIQGVPTATEEGAWHYGNSKVNFSKGVVTSWKHDPSHPLKAGLRSNQLKSTATSFTVGSPKADVRAAQGAPLVESENVWDYGVSKVYFSKGKVTGWDSSPLRPLKFRR
jgi:hypothetical protein